MEFQYDVEVNARTGTFGYLPAGEGWRNGMFHLPGLTLQQPLRVGDRVYLNPNEKNKLIHQRDLGTVKDIELVENSSISGGRLVVAHLNYFLWSAYSADLNFSYLDGFLKMLSQIKEGKIDGLTAAIFAPITIERAKPKRFCFLSSLNKFGLNDVSRT